MKSKTVRAMILAGVMTAVLAGCGSRENNQDAPATERRATQATEEKGQEDTQAQASEAVTGQIEPKDAAVDINNLNDCTIKAGFENKDIYLNDDGALVIDLTIYDYDIYDAEDISDLKEGDKIVSAGRTVDVQSVKRTGDYVLINEGSDSDEIDLIKDRDSEYYPVVDTTTEPFPDYTQVGQVTVPVDEDFEYHDNSDPANQDVVYHAGDLLGESGAVDFKCNEYNGQVHIENGKIVEITRIYIP